MQKNTANVDTYHCQNNGVHITTLKGELKSREKLKDSNSMRNIGETTHLKAGKGLVSRQTREDNLYVRRQLIWQP